MRHSSYWPIILILELTTIERGGGGCMTRAAMPVAGQPQTAAAAAVPPPPPPQAAIDQLTAMGFDHARVRQALQQSDNNIEPATDRLLTSG
jgi:hypothetical protein